MHSSAIKVRYAATYEENARALAEPLSGLAEWEVLGGRCGACDRTGWVDKRKIRRAFGDMTLHQVMRKLVCRICRNREKNMLLIGKLPR